MTTLKTWSGRSQFKYSGTVVAGTDIWYGENKAHVYISSQIYSALLLHFKGLEVSIGTSRTAAPRGSVGEWLQKHIKTAVASYIGPILIHEEYAERGSTSDRIKFKS